MDSQLQYQVLITPLVAKNVYGETADITKDINISEFVSNIGKISNQIDNGDYEFGVFTFSDIDLDVINYDGKFNDESSSYSMFKYRRDLAKVSIKFINTAGTSTIQFEGIINDEGTRQDNNKGTVKIKVLSLSSIFRKTKVPAGIITNGTSFSDAIKFILNITDIIAVLNIDPSKVTVKLDSIVDNGSKFDDKTVQEALNNLLLVSSSVLFVDASNTVIVTSRQDTDIAMISKYYAGNDVLGRENILSITNFNNGLHRMFNSISINDIANSDPISINRYGVRTKSFNFEFLTDANNYIAIANGVLDDFRHPKTEMEVKIRTEDLPNIKLLDLIIIDLTSAIKPAEGLRFFPIYGISKYAQDNYPLTNNPLPVFPNELFRVIGIFKDPKNFTTALKIRSSGIFLNENQDILPVYGQAIYGYNKYQSMS